MESFVEEPTSNERKNWIKIVLIISFFCLSSLLMLDKGVSGQSQNQTQPANLTNITNAESTPLLTDRNLKVESVANGFDFPTSITFLGKDDILLLEKNTGKVLRIVQGKVMDIVTRLNVSIEDERGLLGIATMEDGKSKREGKFIFLYYTYCPNTRKDMKSDSSVCGNFVYRYNFDSEKNKFLEAKLILSLPALPGPSHTGGVLLSDKDKNLYATIGDLQSSAFNKNKKGFDTKAQNILDGGPPDGRAGILKFTSDGKPADSGILGSKYPLNLYYAYGVRNSFGMDIDPLTGNLWDTENGPQFGDEVNFVEKGFNSGWEKIQGIWKLNQTKGKNGIQSQADTEESSLVEFGGKGKYSSPEFVWDTTAGPTALTFLDSDKLGKEYENDMFVGSVNNGIIYRFDLSEDRKSLSLSGDLADMVLNRGDNFDQIVFGRYFGGVTDLEVGPDGYLYVVSGDRETNEGAIYRVVPN
jgi:glucose/arabinose dehydrogenase